MKLRFLAIIAGLLLISTGLAACGGSGDVSADAPTKISEFASVDLSGAEVNQEIFADADITMINFWGTYCGPCIAEMPDLAVLMDAYGGRAQLIGVPIDVDFSKPDSDEYKAALGILETAGASFTNVSPTGDLAKYVDAMQYVPTSIFVDKEGNIVGGPVVGGQIDEYKKVIEENLL